ncbi:MAG: alanine--tRNA ligase [bacterium]|nr:alanine--tRNA ligase [bacterium]
MTGTEIRTKFLNYFKSLEHTIKPSASLVPTDPTILFTIAGMVPFKPIFLGEVTPLPFTRAASCQRCIRTNDLENVGKTARHHTFFEMLGNFSFGDYFKEEAIAWAWEFLVKIVGLPIDRLWVSVYEKDDEAEGLWRKFVKPERIVRLGEKDNFWKMGETGPCGPCSEILYDQGEEAGCGKPDCGVGCSCDRYMELWNLVFTQFDRAQDGSLSPLPKKNIDTGMGLERLAAVMQGVKTNFDTDLVKPIIDYVAQMTKFTYGTDLSKDVALRVIADHLRGITYLIADGVIPSNEARGYVLRALIRRAMRTGRKLGLDESFLFQVVPTVVKIFNNDSNLGQERDHISRIVKLEEDRFMGTLDRGLIILEDIINEYKRKSQGKICGTDIFKLYDTYGFPVDVTQEIAFESGLKIDMDGFKEEMENQRKQARLAGRFFRVEEEKEVRLEGETKFVGYELSKVKARVLMLRKDKNEVEQVTAGDEVEIVLDGTPFYAESGGQTSDTGFIKGDDVELVVTGAKWSDKVILHQAKVQKGELKLKCEVEAEIDLPRRVSIAANHTATHLLQAALRQVLGSHVKQSGSFVGEDYLRFDFTHLEAMKERELRRVEEIVNEKIRENLPVTTSETTLEEAIASGAMALFEEEYGERVRAVKIGDFSLELCGGTHLKATGETGLFKLLNESGIAAGTRRIEAITGEAAYQHVCRQEEQVSQLANLLKTSPREITQRVERLLQGMKEQEKELAQLKSRMVSYQIPELVKDAVMVEGIKTVARELPGMDANALRHAADLILTALKSGVVVLASSLRLASSENKVFWVVKVSQDLTDRVHAGKLINELAKITGGGGGGRADFAQAGGTLPDKINEAMSKIINYQLTIINCNC